MKKELHVVAAAIIQDNKVFTAQRGNKGKTAFKWEFPGGKIEPGETPQEALAREINEEFSGDIKVNELITSIVDEYDDVILYIDTYQCSLVSKTLVLKEHINMKWATSKELDKLEFSAADKPTLAKIKKDYLK